MRGPPLRSFLLQPIANARQKSSAVEIEDNNVTAETYSMYVQFVRVLDCFQGCITGARETW
jgi:hypothetical protein